jgi:hypothetical protein
VVHAVIVMGEKVHHAAEHALEKAAQKERQSLTLGNGGDASAQPPLGVVRPALGSGSSGAAAGSSGQGGEVWALRDANATLLEENRYAKHTTHALSFRSSRLFLSDETSVSFRFVSFRFVLCFVSFRLKTGNCRMRWRRLQTIQSPQLTPCHPCRRPLRQLGLAVLLCKARDGWLLDLR